MLARLLVIAVAGLLVAFDAKEDATKEDLKKLEGTWVVVSAAERGQEAPADVLKNLDMRFTFAGSKVTIKLPKKDKAEEGTFSIDPTQKPKQIDINSGSAEIRGIYALEGETLKLCLVKEKDKKRPADFTTQPDDGHGLFVFKREKK